MNHDGLHAVYLFIFHIATTLRWCWSLMYFFGHISLGQNTSSQTQLKQIIKLQSKQWSYTLPFVTLLMWQLLPLILFLFSYHWFFASQGASTLYGPHTLSAYIQEFKKLASAIITGQPVEPGPQPPDLLEKQISLLTPVVMDATPSGMNFGDVSSDVPKNSTFKRGDLVTVAFWSACPRNDLKTEGTFALVEILHGKDAWVPAYDDDDFCLRFKWSRPSKLSARSQATIEWRIPESALAGVYRVRHFGASKSIIGSVRHFTGSSSAFVVAWESLLYLYICTAVCEAIWHEDVYIVYIYMYGNG